MLVSIVQTYDGDVLRFTMSEEEARHKFVRDTPTPVQDYSKYRMSDTCTHYVMQQYDKSHLHQQQQIMTREKSVIDIVNEAQHAMESLREILHGPILIPYLCISAFI